MSTSTRFAVAIHILTNITLCRGQTVRSEDIARSVNTNPTVVRRILGALAEAGLTYSQMGQGGGALLALRPASPAVWPLVLPYHNIFPWLCAADICGANETCVHIRF